MSLKEVMAVFPQNTIFFETLCTCTHQRDIIYLPTHTHSQQIDRFSGFSTGLNLLFLIPNPSMQKHIIHSCSCKIHLHRYEASIDISTDLLLVLSVVSSNPQQIPRFRWYSVVYLLWSGEGKVFIMIPAHLVSSDRHTWHRDLVTPRHHSIAPARVVIIISEQSGPGPGHSPRTPLLPRRDL